jgi:hypothetical protein
MAENQIRERRGDGVDIEEQGSTVRNGTRQPVNISSKNGAISVNIASIDESRRAIRE